ncbi:MAG: hypothetical protein ACREXT_12795, partial [Gammaproteobacteria bacterium]
SMSTLYVMVPRGAGSPSTAETDIRRLCRYKHRPARDRLRCAWAEVALLGRETDRECTIARDPAGSWLCHAGVWIHRGSIGADDTTRLLARYLEVGADVLASELEGVFVVVIGDAQTREVIAITDACGSLHCYRRETSTGVALCTSSLALSEAGALDPIATHEFIATGIIYEDRSLWRGVRKLPPASVMRISPSGISAKRYWHLAEMRPETLTADVAADALQSALVAACNRIGQSYRSVAADLTGGYDSRMLLCGLLASGIAFKNTVSGPADSPDVLIARRIADALRRPLRHTPPAHGVTVEKLNHAVRLCDGEYDVFDFARILDTHLPASRCYALSMNGSFGELSRGYWWELLWPSLARMQPLDTGMVARKRFAAVAYDASIFSADGELPLAEHLDEVAQRVIAPLQHLPNTSQMDAVYFSMRMQRWQGRIASTTNQIWPALSPLGFPSVLAPVLSARADARFRSLLARTLFARHHPLLADIPLEHGYPPCPARLTNLYRFWPVAAHYGGKVREKISAKFARVDRNAAPPAASARYPALFAELPVAEWLRAPKLLESGLFAPPVLAFLDPRHPLSGRAVDQWQRLLSIEWSLRAHLDANSATTATSDPALSH